MIYGSGEMSERGSRQHISIYYVFKEFINNEHPVCSVWVSGGQFSSATGRELVESQC